MKAADAKQRFQIGLLNADKNYVTLDIKPLLARDKQEFSQAKMALLAPGNVGRLPEYLPYDVILIQPNGNTEYWKVREHTVNSPLINEKTFQFELRAGWKLQPAPAAGQP
jgi:TIGR03009 family protein